MRSIEWWHFQLPWRTPNPVLKVTAILKSNISKQCIVGTTFLFHTNRKPNIWNGTMFGDLDWPLNASRRFVSISWASCYCSYSFKFCEMTSSYCRLSVFRMRTAQQYMALLKLSSCMMRIETPDFILWIYGLRIVQTSTQLAIRYGRLCLSRRNPPQWSEWNSGWFSSAQFW